MNNQIPKYNSPVLIAEIGCNHMGDMKIAKQMIDTLCHILIKNIKFQKRNIKKVSTTINQSGFDLTYVVKKNSKNYVASLRNNDSKIKLDIFSNLPGVQLYTSQGLNYQKKLFPYQGICLETQFFPDAPNNKRFPSTLIKPNKRYSFFTKFLIKY